VVQIWPGQTVTCLHTNSPGHIWTTLYFRFYVYGHATVDIKHSELNSSRSPPHLNSICIYIFMILTPLHVLHRICLSSQWQGTSYSSSIPYLWIQGHVREVIYTQCCQIYSQHHPFICFEHTVTLKASNLKHTHVKCIHLSHYHHISIISIIKNITILKQVNYSMINNNWNQAEVCNFVVHLLLTIYLWLNNCKHS
jgi:hypothetical protein